MIPSSSPTSGVRRFFEQESARFDSIYGGRRSLRERIIDLLFHRVIRLRFARTLRILDPIAGKRILDVGCGPGHYLVELLACGAREAVGVDFAPAMLERARIAADSRGVGERAHLVAGDFLEADLSGPFDAGVAIGYFEYLDQPLVHLRRLGELVDGDLVVSFPKRYTLRTLPRAVRYRLRGCYLRFFTADEIRRLAAAAGLRDVTVHSVSRDYLLHARTPSASRPAEGRAAPAATAQAVQTTSGRAMPAAGERIRILHVITRLIVGGAMENTLLTVIGQMRDPRFEVTLFSGIDDGPEGNLNQVAQSHGVKLVLSRHLVREIRPFSDLRALIELTRFIRAGRFHIVHTHASKAGILGRIAARLGGAPIVVHTLHSLVFHEFQSPLANRFYIGLKRLCAPLTDQFISVSDSTARGALAAGIGDPSRHATVVSGMDLAPFLEAEEKFDPAAARRRFGLPIAAPVVGKVARLFPLKGHEQFLVSAAAIHRRRPDVHFLLVGDGVLRKELEAEVARQGLKDRVHFAGLIPPAEIPLALIAMDVVVHTSLREGIARVLPQALAVGRPVVTFALDGASEVVEDGLSGYTVKPLDSNALAERVLELLANPDRRRAMAAHGRAYVAREFPVERMIERINALYERLLLRRGLLIIEAAEERMDGSKSRSERAVDGERGGATVSPGWAPAPAPRPSLRDR